MTNSNASIFSFEVDPASGNGISHKCLRLNTSLNCTKLEGALDNSVDNVQYNRDKNVTAQARGEASSTTVLLWRPGSQRTRT